jgi:hypothetical protein
MGIPGGRKRGIARAIGPANALLTSLSGLTKSPVCPTDMRGEQRCLSLSHLWRLTVARVFDKLVRIYLAISDEKSKLLPVVLFLGVYSDGYE